MRLPTNTVTLSLSAWQISPQRKKSFIENLFKGSTKNEEEILESVAITIDDSRQTIFALTTTSQNITKTCELHFKKYRDCVIFSSWDLLFNSAKEAKEKLRSCSQIDRSTHSAKSDDAKSMHRRKRSLTVKTNSSIFQAIPEEVHPSDGKFSQTGERHASASRHHQLKNHRKRRVSAPASISSPSRRIAWSETAGGESSDGSSSDDVEKKRKRCSLS